jgi:hypothetical protein
MNFTEVEREVARLRQDVAAGCLTEVQFKAHLREMMVEDEEGNWWMVGYETGEWYRHDGTDWVPNQPPGRAALGATPQPVAQTIVPTKPEPRRFWGIVVLLLGLVVTLCVGLGMAWVLHEVVPFYDLYILEIEIPVDWAGAIIGWFGGLILTIIITRKVWRGK